MILSAKQSSGGGLAALRPKDTLSRIPLGIASAVLLLAVAGLFAYLFWADFETRNRQAAIQASNLAGVIASDFENTMLRADSDIRSFVHLLGSDDFARSAPEWRRDEINGYLADQLRGFLQLFAYRVFDTEGRAIFGAGSDLADADVSRQGWFTELRGGADMVLSQVIIGQGNGQPMMMMGVPVRDHGHRVIGIVIAELNLGYYQGLINSLDVGHRGMIAIRRSDDGRLILRHPESPENVNQPIRSWVNDEIGAGQSVGTRDFISELDNVQRRGAFRGLRNYPIFVLVAISRADYLAAWTQQTLILGAAGVLLVLLLGVLIFRQGRAEAEVRATSSRLSSIMETAAEGVIVISRGSRVLVVNRAAAEILGWPSTEAMVGKTSVEALGHVVADGSPCGHTTCSIRTTVRDGQTRRVADEHFTAADGEKIPIEYVVSALVEDGVHVGAVVVFHNISERKALEAELRRSNLELEQFAYATSHDLRQPLRMVSSYLTIIEKKMAGSLSEDLRTFMDFAIDGAKRMDALILGLLDYSRVGREQNYALVSLAEVVGDALDSMLVTMAEAGGEVTIAAEMPVVSGNRVELMRLFLNLIGNAVKYRRPQVPLRIEIGWQDGGGDWLAFVADNGSGIDPCDFQRAFGIFQRLVTDVEGTGIGLAICRKIVEQHGGRIWIESARGEGARFVMSFPKPVLVQEEARCLVCGPTD